MSEEILAAAGDIAYWRRRAERAESDAAALKEALDLRHSCENCGGKGSYWTDVGGEAEHEVCDCWIETDNTLKQEHAGASLLADTIALRETLGHVDNVLRIRHMGGWEANMLQVVDSALTAEHPGAALLRELALARAVVAVARLGFGTDADLQHAYGFDPSLLSARIDAYDAAVKASGRNE